MFLRQLEYLIAVIEEDHFGRAAEKCYVKQPSLSNGIKQLESELGITLFKRGRGQRLYGITEEGKKVSKWARLILANFKRFFNFTFNNLNYLIFTIRNTRIDQIWNHFEIFIKFSYNFLLTF